MRDYTHRLRKLSINFLRYTPEELLELARRAEIAYYAQKAKDLYYQACRKHGHPVDPDEVAKIMEEGAQLAEKRLSWQ